jgi:hypothetical protein
MAAGGFKTFIAGETLDEDEINDFLMQGVLVFADTGSRGSAVAAPVEGQFAFLKDTDKLTFYDGSNWVDYDAGYIQATVASTTGSPATGSFTDVNGLTWDYYDFTGDGSITISAAGYADCLVIGGGGGGAQDTSEGRVARAGGGAGAVRFGLQFLPAATHTITVGAGGAGQVTTGTSDVFADPGGTTTLGSVIRAGGGGEAGANQGGGNELARAYAGGGGSPGGLAISTLISLDRAGAGAGGATNNYDGLTLNYNNSSVEYGRGGRDFAVVANTGSGGQWTGGAGAAGRVIVRVLA